LIFGYKLSISAEGIAGSGKFSRGFMGIFFLAAITSFPEISTSIASVSKIYAPNLAVGDLIGSVIFNTMVIAILDFKYRKGPILSSINKGNLVTSGFLLLALGILLAMMGIALFTGNVMGKFNMGLEGILIIAIYLLGIIYAYKRDPGARADDSRHNIKEYILFILYASIIIASGFWFASLGKEIVVAKGWNEMYFGTIVMALATSLPEIVVAIAAVSIGSIDMAVANILGSNLLDIAVIPLTDAAFRYGYLLQNISHAHIYSAFFAIILTIIVLISMYYRPKRTIAGLGIGTIVLIFTFLVGNLLLFKLIHI